MNDTRFQRQSEVLEGLRSVKIVRGQRKIAIDLLAAGKLEKYTKGHQLIVRGAFDRDVYLILAGSLAADINGHRQICRGPGETIGEMSTLSPECRRTADVFVEDEAVLWRIPAHKFKSICLRHPEMAWRLARSIAVRLDQRNRHYAPQSSKPVVFLISSTEQLDIVESISAALSDHAHVVPWNVSYWASGYPLEALESWVERCDFAIAVAALDDVVETRQTKHGIVRDNVLFEIGLFMSRLGRSRTLVLVEKDRSPLTSDLKGMTTLFYEIAKSDTHKRSVKIEEAIESIKSVISQHGLLPKLLP